MKRAASEVSGGPNGDPKFLRNRMRVFGTEPWGRNLRARKTPRRDCPPRYDARGPRGEAARAYALVLRSMKGATASMLRVNPMHQTRHFRRPRVVEVARLPVYRRRRRKMEIIPVIIPSSTV